MIIGVFESWCNTSARLKVFGGSYGASAELAPRPANSQTVSKATDKINYETADRTTIEDAGRAISRAKSRATRRAIDRAVGKTTNETNCEADAKAVYGAIGESIAKAIDRAIDRATDTTNCEAVGKAIYRAIGGTTRKAVGRAVGRATGEIDCIAASRATNGAANRIARQAINRAIGRGKANYRATGKAISGTAGRVWTNITIILTNLLAYMLKLEKQSRQPKSSFFYSCSTDVILKTTYTSRCL